LVYISSILKRRLLYFNQPTGPIELKPKLH